MIVEQAPKKSSRRKKYWLTGGAVVATILVLFWVAASNLDAWAEKKLTEQVSTKSKGVYSLQMKELDITLLAGSAALEAVELIPNDSVWQQLQRKSPGQAPANTFQVKAGRVKVQGISFMKLLFGGPLSVHTLQLDEPEVLLRQMKQDTSSQPLHKKVGEQFKGLAVQEIKIRNGGFRYRPKNNHKADLFTLAGVDIQANGVKLDSASYEDKSRAYYSKAITFTAKEGTFHFPDGNYQLKGKVAKVSTQEKEAVLENVRLIPLRSASEMSRKAKMAVTRFKVQVPAITMKNIDFSNAFRNSALYMSTLVLQKPRVSAFKDGKNFPAKGNGYLPHDLIRQVSFGLNVRRAQVTDMYVHYEQLAEKAFRTGYVTGSNIDLTLTNLTNDRTLVSHKNPAVLKARGLVMGKAVMEATVRLALLDPSGYHSIEGTIGKGNPAILNPIIEPSMFVRVKSGYLQKGSFRLELTKASASGSMQLQYDDFKVDLLNKSEDRKQSLGNKIKSLAANKLVLKSESEKDGKAPREGDIKVKRRAERSFLTYWKDCLANGVLSVIGAPM
ncbi:hypothetical protein [Sabulibacter ruber]|uniref:hypothetical protein n=1 Tax=Sabulibacter ruber TaxID=2811901 RepID=UPI001A971E07|nr:hypothetical protein [Sabulibacter ruber]